MFCQPPLKSGPYPYNIGTWTNAQKYRDKWLDMATVFIIGNKVWLILIKYWEIMRFDFTFSRPGWFSQSSDPSISLLSTRNILNSSRLGDEVIELGSLLITCKAITGTCTIKWMTSNLLGFKTISHQSAAAYNFTRSLPLLSTPRFPLALNRNICH